MAHASSTHDRLFPARPSCLLFFGTALLLTLSVGCQQHPRPHPVPQVLAPTIESEPAQPPAETPVTESEPENQPEPAANTPAPARPKPRPRRPIVRRQPVPEPPKETPKPAENGGAQITADVPRAAVQTQRQNAEALLRNSNDRLNRINRNLSDGERSMLQQARNYIAQAGLALETGDTERAYNLAVKANLLTNELTK